MFESIMNFFKKLSKKEKKSKESSNTAKERLHLVLMQDRANVSADFLELMRQEIIEVIKKYIDIDEKAIDVKLTNKTNEDGTIGAPALYANIPIVTIKNETRKVDVNSKQEPNKETDKELNKESNSLANETNNSEQKEKIENTDGEEGIEEQKQVYLEKNNNKSQDIQENQNNQNNLENQEKQQEKKIENKEEILKQSEETVKGQENNPKQEKTNKQENANKQEVKANS